MNRPEKPTSKGNGNVSETSSSMAQRQPSGNRVMDEVHTTVIENHTVVCFIKQGHVLLCFSQLLRTVLENFGLDTIDTACDLLRISFLDCSVYQLNRLKKLGAVAPGETGCTLIKRREAGRLLDFLLQSGPSHLPGEVAQPMDVSHRCFGGCKGRYIFELDKESRSRCVQCTECLHLYSLPQFVCHTHVPGGRSNSSNFDPLKWDDYIRMGHGEVKAGKYHRKIFLSLRNLSHARHSAIASSNRLKDCLRYDPNYRYNIPSELLQLSNFFSISPSVMPNFPSRNVEEVYSSTSLSEPVVGSILGNRQPTLLAMPNFTKNTEGTADTSTRKTESGRKNNSEYTDTSQKESVSQSRSTYLPAEESKRCSPTPFQHTYTFGRSDEETPSSSFSKMNSSLTKTLLKNTESVKSSTAPTSNFAERPDDAADTTKAKCYSSSPDNKSMPRKKSKGQRTSQKVSILPGECSKSCLPNDFRHVGKFTKSIEEISSSSSSKNNHLNSGSLLRNIQMTGTAFHSSGRKKFNVAKKPDESLNCVRTGDIGNRNAIQKNNTNASHCPKPTKNDFSPDNVYGHPAYFKDLMQKNSSSCLSSCGCLSHTSVCPSEVKLSNTFLPPRTRSLPAEYLLGNPQQTVLWYDSNLHVPIYHPFYTPVWPDTTVPMSSYPPLQNIGDDGHLYMPGRSSPLYAGRHRDNVLVPSTSRNVEVNGRAMGIANAIAADAERTDSKTKRENRHLYMPERSILWYAVQSRDNVLVLSSTQNLQVHEEVIGTANTIAANAERKGDKTKEQNVSDSEFIVVD